MLEGLQIHERGWITVGAEYIETNVAVTNIYLSINSCYCAM